MWTRLKNLFKKEENILIDVNSSNYIIEVYSLIKQATQLDDIQWFCEEAEYTAKYRGNKLGFAYGQYLSVNKTRLFLPNILDLNLANAIQDNILRQVEVKNQTAAKTVLEKLKNDPGNTTTGN